MEKFVFFGEFGYLQQVILPYTQRYVIKHPEKKGTITLITFAGNDICFDYLFPGFFNFTLMPFKNERDGFYSPMDKLFPNTPHISKMFEETLPIWLGELPYSRNMSKYYLHEPIPCPTNKELDTLAKTYNYVVVCFFRNRNHDLHRNYSSNHEKLRNVIENHLHSEGTLLCIMHASDECAVPEYIDTSNKNVHLIKSLGEAAYWFHTCNIAYMNDSGLCDYAKNCNIKKLIIVPGTNNVLFNSCIYYKPFDTEIEVLGDYTLQLPVL